MSRRSERLQQLYRVRTYSVCLTNVIPASRALFVNLICPALRIPLDADLSDGVLHTCRSNHHLAGMSDALLDDLPEGLGIDIALFQPVLAASRMLVKPDVDAAATSTEGDASCGGVTEQLLLQCAAAARRRGNLALTARLLQQCRDLTAPDEAAGLAKRIEQAELVWAESPLPEGRLQAAKLLSDRLRLPIAGASEASASGDQLKARGWLLFHSWLVELNAARHEQAENSSIFPADAFDRAHGLIGHFDQLSVLEQMQLSAAERDAAFCLQSAVAADENSAGAWRALGAYLHGTTAAPAGTEEQADAAVGARADRTGRQARGTALFAFCQSLRAAGLSQVQCREQCMHTDLMLEDATC